MNGFSDACLMIVASVLVLLFVPTPIMAAPLSGGVEHAEQLPAMDGTLLPGKGFDSRTLRFTDSGEWFAIPAWLTGTWRTVQLTRIKKVDDGSGLVNDTPKPIKLRERETFGYQRDRLRNVWTLRRAPIVSVGEVSSDDETSPITDTLPTAPPTEAPGGQESNSSSAVKQQVNTGDVKQQTADRTKKPKKEGKRKKEKAIKPSTEPQSDTQSPPVSTSSSQTSAVPLPIPNKAKEPSGSTVSPGLAVSLIIVRDNHLVSSDASRVILRSIDSVVTVREDNNAIESVVRRELIRTIVPVSEGIIRISSDVRVFDQHGFPKYDENLVEIRTKEREFEVVDELKGVSLYASFTKFLQKIGKLSLSPERGD